MRKTSSLPVLFTLSVSFILFCSIGSFAQNREKFVISAKAGGINAITGEASVHSRGESDWQQLIDYTTIWMPAIGCALRTTGASRYSSIRVLTCVSVAIPRSNCQTIRLANLEVRLLRGTAIVEATGADGSGAEHQYQHAAHKARDCSAGAISAECRSRRCHRADRAKRPRDPQRFAHEG